MNHTQDKAKEIISLIQKSSRHELFAMTQKFNLVAVPVQFDASAHMPSPLPHTCPIRFHTHARRFIEFTYT